MSNTQQIIVNVKIVFSLFIHLKVIPKENTRRYQSYHEFGDRLTMLEMKCQTLRTRCNTELAAANAAEKAYWKERVEDKINNPDEVNYNAELQMKVARSLAASEEVKTRIHEIRNAKKKEVRILIVLAKSDRQMDGQTDGQTDGWTGPFSPYTIKQM